MASTTAWLVVSGRGSVAAIERYLYNPGKVIASAEDGPNAVAVIEATTPLVGSDAAHELSHWATSQIDRFASGLYWAKRFETRDEALAESVIRRAFASS